MAKQILYSKLFFAFVVSIVLAVTCMATNNAFAEDVRAEAVQTGPSSTDAFGRTITVQKDPFSGKWKSYANGQETYVTGLASNAYGTWYCINGEVDFSFNGIAEAGAEKYYVQNGKVAYDYSGTISDDNYTYTVTNGQVTEVGLSEQSRNTLILTVLLLAVALAIWLNYRKKKKAGNQAKSAKTDSADKSQAKQAPLPHIDGAYHKTGESIPKDYYKRPATGSVKKVNVKAANTASSHNTAIWPEETIHPQKKKPPKPMPYKRRYLLTQRELSFYKSLKPIADTLGLIVLTKVRMGDLVYPENTWNRSAWNTNWGRIKSRHVDFALAKPSNMYVELLIELDDTTHNSEHAKEADQFKDEVYAFTGYKLLRVNNDYQLEDKVRKKLAE